ncbi:MAG: gliding motility lipoprotein GldD [Bacteroidota bacterium]|jgi:gliding motility-associated lipoprotein GldD
MKYSIRTVTICLLSLAITSCESEFTPKPRGYFRIATPQKSYHLFQHNCPFQFELPQYAVIDSPLQQNSHPCDLNITFNPFKATLYLNFRNFSTLTELEKLIEDDRAMAMKHISRASGLNENPFSFSNENVHGVIYRFKGNSASPFQFYASDSLHNFIRGSLYFYAKPQPDSIAPVEKYIIADIEQIISTLKWKN